ncbi:MAG: epoxyqueuosine reductase [Dethiobacter sp.]|nr:epoxyqueuosine reductase [Dethiobacter sp.]MBS3900961.1 epoxyqueuosine reductase [Dethiobacter sp.]MBS3988556.1 epoxyqueuosine reductase [Dethiobacter sp.]
MKKNISAFIEHIGADDVGFAAATDYHSPNSPSLQSIFPAVKSLIVLAFRELDNCESENMQIAYSGRMDLMEFARLCNYKLARHLQKEYNAKVMTIPLSYPLEMSLKTKGAIADVSLRHAAQAAGLGTFGRHNLVIHPRFDSRVIFAGVLTDLDLASDPPAKERCTSCNICVEYCPGNALADEGKTHLMRCIKNSQPYGIGSSIRFWQQFVDSTAEEQKNMLADEHYWRLYQAGFIGFQYFCFNCITKCPIGKE